MIRARLLFLPALAVWLLLGGVGRALEIQQTYWGFDGRVVADRFNLFSVLVANPGGAPWEGELVLEEDTVGRGAEQVQPLYLGPRSTRWVQFHLLTGDGVGRRTLRWGRGLKERYEMDGPVPGGAPACVWLRDSENPFATSGALKSFPEQLFPTTVAATDALDAVVLDHVPRWEPARREAFLDWVRRGGTVHLLPGADGRLPVFGEDLAALDTAEDSVRLGAGRVVHHTIAPREMSEAYLAGRGFPPRTMAKAQQPVIYALDSSLFHQLAALTKPKVNWALIHVLAIAYVGMIGPLHHYFRRRLDYRVSILAFLGCVGVFGAAFGAVGRRGYGESQTVHTLAVARALGGGRCDVTQWVSAFATVGDVYKLTHRAPVNLYAADPQAGAASERIFNGKEGYMLADIPLYSSRAFTHRAVMTGEDTSVTVEEWEGDDRGLKKLRLRMGAGFPKEFSHAQLVVGDTRHTLKAREAVLELEGTSEKIREAYSREKLQPLAHRFPANEGGSPDAHRDLLPLLAARTLNVPDVFPQTPSAQPPRAGHAQLLITAPAPASFHLQAKGFARERGWVLYVQDVFKP